MGDRGGGRGRRIMNNDSLFFLFVIIYITDPLIQN